MIEERFWLWLQQTVISHDWGKDLIVITTDGDKSWLRKGLYCDYNTLNRSFGICDRYSITVNQAVVPQTLEYHINWRESCTPIESAAGMLNKHWRFTMGKLK
jgi:hypothetical protein